MSVVDICNNPRHKRLWAKRNESPLSVLKAKLHSNKVLLCIYDGIEMESSIMVSIHGNKQLIQTYYSHEDKL